MFNLGACGVGLRLVEHRQDGAAPHHALTGAENVNGVGLGVLVGYLPFPKAGDLDRLFLPRELDRVDGAGMRIPRLVVIALSRFRWR